MGRVAKISHQISWYWATFTWFWSSLMGDNHYRRYVDYRIRTHPGETVIGETEYWRRRYAASESTLSSRCC